MRETDDMSATRLAEDGLDGDDMHVLWQAMHDAAPSVPSVEKELLAALEMAVRQNEHDMLMTGEELRQCSAAIARAKGG